MGYYGCYAKIVEWDWEYLYGGNLVECMDRQINIMMNGEETKSGEE